MNREMEILALERAADALEGIEMLIAMGMEKSLPAAELWVGEGPDRELSSRPWRTSDPLLPRRLEEAESSESSRRLLRLEERLNHLADNIAMLEARVHEEVA